MASTVPARRSARLSANADLKPLAEAAQPQPQPSSRGRKRKSGPAAVDPAEPSTPSKRRTQADGKRPPPATPTPSAVALIGQGTDGFKTLANTSARRLADPRATNAPLLSPETSRVIASKPVKVLPPSKATTVKTTTANILEEACRYLIKVDQRMKPLIEKHHCRLFSPEGLAEKIDPFESLASGIISQQVSGAAARSIKAKFVALFPENAAGRFPQPSQVAPCPLDKLRTAGLSQRKAEYIQGLAEKFGNGELTAQMLADAPYDEVLEKLTAVRGLGRWSVEMFACFGLKRMDVFSLGDLGVQRGMAAFVGRDIAKLKSKGGKWKYMSEADMKGLSDKFAPYRSVFMWYMWRVEETDVSTLE